jgi:hypothetical protein
MCSGLNVSVKKAMSNQNEIDYQELVVKRKIFGDKDNILNWLDIQYLKKRDFPANFDISKVDFFLTFNMIEIDGEYVETGIMKAADKGKFFTRQIKFLQSIL